MYPKKYTKNPSGIGIARDPREAEHLLSRNHIENLGEKPDRKPTAAPKRKECISQNMGETQTAPGAAEKWVKTPKPVANCWKFPCKSENFLKRQPWAQLIKLI